MFARCSVRNSSARAIFVICLGAVLLLSGSLAAQKTPAAAKKAVPALREYRDARRARLMQNASGQDDFTRRGRLNGNQDNDNGQSHRAPREQRMRRADAFDGDLRALPQAPDRWPQERPEREEPRATPVLADSGDVIDDPGVEPAPGVSVAAVAAAAPSPDATFDGLDHAGFGAGYPPDTNGDVGPDYFIQTINASVGIFRKTDRSRVAAFSFNTLMSQGHFGNLCDTNNFGDPVALYDTFEDRWVLTDFAFQLDASKNVVNPPGAFQCFAVSKSGDPLSGGWYFYSVNTAGGLGDYPKFGIWPDGVYMSANMFDYAASGSFQNPRVYAFNKAQMYAGGSVVQVVSFDAPVGDFTLLPSNARLQTGTPSAGTPNYFVSTWQFLNAVGVYKFHVDWNSISLSTFTGPDFPIAATSWPSTAPGSAPSQGGNNLDVLAIRAMMQAQYSNIGGAESLWATHTVRRANSTGFAAPRWYQLNVTGGTVAPVIPQAATWDPDAANVMHRFVPSLAVNRNGDLALGYSTSSSTRKPAIKYAGRLSTDPINTFSQTEQVLVQGGGTQTNQCGGGNCTRWGDYAAMTLDPDGCTFWMTSEYYQVDGNNYNTRIGSFAFPGCATVVNGMLQGTVRSSANVPVPGATVALGSRTTTTDSNGFYAFASLPAGTYPSVTATYPGLVSQSFAGIVVNEGGTTTRDFVLGAAPSAACLVDTTHADFAAGVPSNCDLTGTPGSVSLVDAAKIDQQQLNSSSSGLGITLTQWLGQTFVPSATGKLTKLDVSLFCATCSGANPPIVVDVRATSGGLPTSTVLASTTIAGFSSGSSAFYSAMFATPVTLNGGTQYAYTLKITTARIGTYAAIHSTTPAAYPNGDRVISTNSGSTWSVPTTSGIARDLAFKTYMDTGFASSGTFVSSMKDANPVTGAIPNWSSISWNGSVPAGTTLGFQVAGTNDPGGVFNFVGPDGTAASFYTTSGGSLAQFNGKRYLKYRAVMTTSNPALAPAIDDVTMCFADVPSATTLSVAPSSGVYGGTTTLSATLTVGSAGLAGRSVAFTLNGVGVGSSVTNGAGIATIADVSLAGTNAGTYPEGVAASFSGESGYTASAASSTLTVAKAPQEIAFAALPDKLATDPPFPLSATGGASGNPVTFSTASTACSVSGSTVTLNAAGACAIDADQAGNDNYEAAPRVTRAFTIDAASQTVSFAPLADRTYGAADFDVTARASSGLPVSFAVSGACSISAVPAFATVHITGAGVCALTASQGGDAKYDPAASVTRSFTIHRAPLIVAADSKSKLLNAVNPPLTGTVSGVVGADGITATYSTEAVTLSPVGVYPIAATVVDPNGRLDNYDVTIVNGTLTIGYSAAACLGSPGHQVLAPIDAGGASVFQQGSTLPVKFRVCDVNGVSIGISGVVAAFHLIQTVSGTAANEVSQTPASTTPDAAFRWDTTGQQWIFNLSTRELSAGTTYGYRVQLNDGSVILFRFGLR